MTSTANSHWFNGGGEMGGLIRSMDWADTPLGPQEHWPQALKTALRIVLDSRYPMFLWWGPELTNLYNDAYIPVLGQRHPRALGRQASHVWSEIWDQVGPQTQAVLNENRATWNEDRLLVMERNGYPEETFFTFSYSPIPNDQGGVGGVFCACMESTRRVLGERRLAILRQLASLTGSAQSVSETCAMAATTLAEHSRDVSFALMYLIQPGEDVAHLCGRTGIALDATLTPELVSLRADETGAEPFWPFRQGLAGKSVAINGLRRRSSLPGGAWPETTDNAMLLPLKGGHDAPIGFLIVGASPRQAFDDAYQGFFELVAGSLARSITTARTYEDERRRAEALEELDRAKTEFFNNVSHEFRTPLTLMLGPIEEELRERPDAPRLEMAHRNSLRLLRLVNHLLDFSRIEAGRIDARYEPTDLAVVTQELASVFRSAMEKAGLALELDCPSLPDRAYVDREMWEKIVLNLLSNAFKFTFHGHIALSLRQQSGMIELRVRDTGVGIPPDALPHLFERFYRVQHQRSRTHEGTGIGLALVHELVQLHGGTIRVDSQVERGSTFVVAIPTGTRHLPADKIVDHSSPHSAGRAADAYVEEARRWLPDECSPVLESANAPPDDLHHPATGLTPRKAHILVVDDNADMRQYIVRLLAPRYQVVAVADGRAALAQVRLQTPDLILSDIMMPNLDGFGLVRALRSDPTSKAIPVVLLSARAGEEARIEGLQQDVDDYLVKPFSAGELLARVESHLKMAQARAAMTQTLRESEERFRNMADYSPMMLWVTDAEGRCTYLNQRWYEFTGQSSENSLGFGWLDALHPDDCQAAAEMFRSSNEQRAAFRMEYRLRRQDGEYRWVIDAAVPRLGPQRQFIGYIGSVIDITDRKQAEEALRRMNDELEMRVTDRTSELVVSQNRLRDLTTELNLAEQRERRRLATELHDYLAQLLALSRIRLAQAKRHAVTPAMNATLDEVQEVIDQSLTYTRTLVAQLSPPMLKDFGLPIALRWLAEQMRQRNLEVSLDLDRAMVSLPEDHAMLLFQSVRELLMNIVKHADTHQARITTRESGGWLTISVTDEGLGFDPKTASTADHDRSGPGFGLFSIRERMFALGGRFDLSSQPGKGTVATLSLPLARPGDDRTNENHANINRTTAHPTTVEPTVIAAPRTFHPADDKWPPIRVLIADDHAMVRQGLRGLLAGYADIDVVGEASQGEEAVNLALRLQPDIVLMDVNMPVMDGIEATRHITEALPMTRIIGLSVQTAGQVETAIREAGALAFLNKEAAVEDLYNTIHALQTTGAPPSRNQTACASPIPKPSR